MEVERKRPIKQYKVLIAYGPYRKGDKIQPTGMFRDVLLRRGLIAEVVDTKVAEPLTDRMVHMPKDTTLHLNKRGKENRR